MINNRWLVVEPPLEKHASQLGIIIPGTIKTHIWHVLTPPNRNKYNSSNKRLPLPTYFGFEWFRPIPRFRNWVDCRGAAKGGHVAAGCERLIMIMAGWNIQKSWIHITHTQLGFICIRWYGELFRMDPHIIHANLRGGQVSTTLKSSRSSACSTSNSNGWSSSWPNFRTHPSTFPLGGILYRGKKQLTFNSGSLRAPSNSFAETVENTFIPSQQYCPFHSHPHTNINCKMRWDNSQS